MRRSLGVLTAIAIGALPLAFGAPSAIRAVGAAGPLRMTVGTLGSIGSLDPRHGDSVIAREVWNIQYPTLTALDPETLAPTTGIADAWSPLPGGHGWKYSLRPTQTWTDGTPVTAADVVYSLDHARDDHWPYAPALIPGLSGLSARAVNAHTVDVTSRSAHPSPGLLLNIVPAHVYSKVADIDTDLTALGVGEGAWHVVSKSADAVELGVLGRPAGPPLDQIVFRTYPDADALLAALSHGQADVISGVPDADVNRLDAMAKVTVDHASDGTEYVLELGSYPAAFRRAVSLAIDRTELVAKAVNGVGTPAPFDAQPGRAKRELAAIPQGSELEPTIAMPTDPTGQRVGAFVQQALKAAGLPTHAVDADATSTNPPNLVVARVAVRDVPAGAIALFEPDTLQAFRTDNVTGFLQEPSQRSLVVFGPTVAQYGAIAAAQKPPGEKLANSTYAIGAAVLLALCGAGYWIASRLRKRFVTSLPAG